MPRWIKFVYDALTWIASRHQAARTYDALAWCFSLKSGSSTRLASLRLVSITLQKKMHKDEIKY